MDLNLGEKQIKSRIWLTSKGNNNYNDNDNE